MLALRRCRLATSRRRYWAEMICVCAACLLNTATFDIVEGQAGPALGERIELLVGYSDSTTFLHNYFVAVRKGRVEKIWDISARGLLR